MKCLIISGGTINRKKLLTSLMQDADLIVCADGGAGHIRSTGILPDAIIGDFDSITQEDKTFFENKNIKMIKFPRDKDATDTELAASWAVEHRATHITFTGVSGVRLDHSLSNIFLLKKLGDLNVVSCIIDDNNEIHLVRERITLPGKPGERLSVIPATETVEGITLEGLAYPLHNARMTMGSSLGISNRYASGSATVSIKSGLLIVTKSTD